MKKSYARKFLFAIISIFIFILPMQSIFADNSPSQWAFNDIEKAIKYNLTSEKVLTNYQGYITREEFCELSLKLYYALGGNEVKIQFRNPFIDTANRNIINAYYLGLVEGVSENQFLPYRTVPREEIAVMFYRVIKAARPNLKLITSHEIIFEDISEISEWALHEIRYMNSIGIINGLDNNLLAPKKATTKEQSIVLSLRVFEKFFENKLEYSTGLFWEVLNGNNAVYLLGSLNIGNESLYPLICSIETAYEKSNVFIVETVPTEKEYVNSDIAQKFLYTDGTNIKNHISNELYTELNQALTSFEKNISFIEMFKPWVISFIMEEYDYVNQGYSAELGIDYYFISKALREQNKKIVELEGAELQINMFSELPDDLQETLLKEKLINLDNSEQTYTQLMDAWKAGNIDKLEKMMFKSDENNLKKSMINKLLYEERNNNITNKIISCIEEEGSNTYFVMLSAEHLLGETGIMNNLQNKGYELKRILK